MSGRPKNAIVIVIDGLQAGMVGCYGNTWIKTPEIDRLAAESFVFDQAIVDGPIPPMMYEAWWAGSRESTWAYTCQGVGSHPPPTLRLPLALSEAGCLLKFITDEPQFHNCALREGCPDAILLEIPAVKSAAHDVQDTQLANFFAVASESLAEAREPFCLWLHSRGMNGPWDAPYEFRKQYADEEDPDPPTKVDPPCIKLAKNYDPDEVLGAQQAYAGQISALDTCLGAFVEQLRCSPVANDTLLIVLASVGFPLGEHGEIGFTGLKAYSEWLHVPMFIRPPDGMSRAARSSALVQPFDLFPTLVEWFGLPMPEVSSGGKSLWPLIRGETESIRDRTATFLGPYGWSLRTEKWQLLASDANESKSEPAKRELYVKPDDRFEVNDVSSRCPEVVAALEEAWRDLVAVAGSGRWEELPPLPEAATESVD